MWNLLQGLKVPGQRCKTWLHAFHCELRKPGLKPTPKQGSMELIFGSQPSAVAAALQSTAARRRDLHTSRAKSLNLFVFLDLVEATLHLRVLGSIRGGGAVEIRRGVTCRIMARLPHARSNTVQILREDRIRPPRERDQSRASDYFLLLRIVQSIVGRDGRGRGA